MPDVSIVIPARDEQNYITACFDSIERAKKQTDKSLEVIVVLNRCTDQTEQLAQTAGARVLHAEGKNLSQIRNVGLRAATAPLLVTIDADSCMAENFLSEVIRVMESGEYVGGGTMIYPERYSLGILATGVALGVMALLTQITAGAFFVSREAYDAIGGFDESRTSAEDVDFAIRLKRYGKKKGLRFKNLFSTSITTSCRKFDEFGDWYLVAKPWEAISLLRGRNSKLADKYWYDVKR